MTKQTDQLKTEIVNKIINYIKSNGKKLTDDFYYWDTYPVVIKDICVSYVVVNNDELQFGDFPSTFNDKDEFNGFDINVNKFKCRKTVNELSSIKADREYLDNTFKGMKIADSKNYKKNWQL